MNDFVVGNSRNTEAVLGSSLLESVDEVSQMDDFFVGNSRNAEAIVGSSLIDDCCCCLFDNS